MKTYQKVLWVVGCVVLVVGLARLMDIEMGPIDTAIEYVLGLFQSGKLDK